MKTLLVICLLMLVLSIAYAQTQTLANFACVNGTCTVSEADIRVVEWMGNKILELQSKTGCT